MRDEEDCKERYENSIIADLRMKIAILEDEKRRAESELTQRLSMLSIGKGKSVVDTQQEIGMDILVYVLAYTPSGPNIRPI